METKNLSPNQIITLNDFPPHSTKELERYFEIYQNGNRETIALCPLMPIEIVIPHFNEDLIKRCREFAETHPKSEYFLLDGTHRTTTATLTNSPIRTIIFRKNSDITKARKLLPTGDLLKNDILNQNIEENCKTLNTLFTEKPYFQTVKEKTERMVRERVIPNYMIKHYQKPNKN